MATSDEKKVNLKFDDFVSKIVADPANPVGHTVLRGFIGSSPEQDHVRVYLDESLNSFVDVRQNTIIYSKELAGNSLGGSVIWVKAGTEYVLGHAPLAHKTKKRYFDGPIYQDYVTSYCNPEGGENFQTQACPTIDCSQACTPGVAKETINYTPVANLKRIIDDESISFQYCATSQCTTACSQTCPTFQYCPTYYCPTDDQHQTIAQRVANNYSRIADDESISFQYCMTTSCTTNCSGSCVTFQYCITQVCPPQEQTEYERPYIPVRNRYAAAGAARNPLAAKGGFNPYRGY